MSKCPNCGAAMSCSCQRRVSRDGVTGCSNCIGPLNAKATTPKPANPVNRNLKPTVQKALFRK